MRRLALVALFCGAATSAAAQSSGKFAAGAQLFTRVAPDPDLDGATGVALLFRVGHKKNGWGWDWGLNWYSTHVDRSLAGTPVSALAELHVRPLMGGYGFSHVFGRATVTTGALGGYAFTSFSKAPSADVVSTDLANTFVVKPQVSIWYDVSDKVGVNLTGGYMVARPRLTVTTALGRDARRIRADMFMIRVGVVYSVF